MSAMPVASAAQAQSSEVDELQARLEALLEGNSSSYVQKNSAELGLNTSSMGIASNKIPVK